MAAGLIFEVATRAKLNGILGCSSCANVLLLAAVRLIFGRRRERERPSISGFPLAIAFDWRDERKARPLVAEPLILREWILDAVVGPAGKHDCKQRAEGDRDALGQTHTLLLPVRDPLVLNS